MLDTTGTPAERLVLAPDCGMKYLTREAAFGKLKARAVLRDTGIESITDVMRFTSSRKFFSLSR